MKMLLVEDEPIYTLLIREMLKEQAEPRFEVISAASLSVAFSRLAEMECEVILLDLNLPDSEGLNTFFAVRDGAPGVPIVIFTGQGNEALGIRAVDEGAQDYLVKGSTDAKLLSRSLRFAIGRQQARKELLSLSLEDELTSLYNRRAFLTLARHHLTVAARMNREALLLYIDLDGMKGINDTYGHQEGDAALTSTAEILRQTFRKSDILARMGGDEFTVLVVDAVAKSTEAWVARLRANLKAFNTASGRRYLLSLGTGVAKFDPQHPVSLEDLMQAADRELYAYKRSRRLGGS